MTAYCQPVRNVPKSDIILICAARPVLCRGGFRVSGLMNPPSTARRFPLAPGFFISGSGHAPFNQCTPLACEQLGAAPRSIRKVVMNFSISPAFEYIGAALEWFWPVMLAGASFGLGYICGGCAQRG